jgi:hypothetical protein
MLQKQKVEKEKEIHKIGDKTSKKENDSLVCNM